MTSAKALLIFVVAIGTVAAWMTRPSGNTIKLETCEPSDLFARASLAIYGNTFWQSQMDGIRQRILSAEKWTAEIDTINSRTDMAISSARQQMEEIYQKYPTMAPSGAQRQADELRKQADEIERRTAFNMMLDSNQKNLAMLKRCESEIKTR